MTAKIDKSAAGLMVEDAKFWVVEPRITLSGVSGLGTLLSGNYIGVRAGQVGQEPAHFTALDAPPSSPADRRAAVRAEGHTTSGRWESARRSTTAACRPARSSGTISPATARRSTITVFVNAPYDKYVKPETRFWNASGLDVSVGAGGLEVRTGVVWWRCSRAVSRSTRPPSCPRPSRPPRTPSSRSTATGPPR